MVSRLILIIGRVAAVAALLSAVAHARSFRLAQVPNGTSIGCALCHVNPGGGGPRNPFGLDVQAITGPVNRPFWSAELAAKDSDGDGFSNGVELGDPDGAFNLIAGWLATRPGDPASKPAAANEPPQFVSSPVTSAVAGLPYEYHATANDPESQTLTFSKVEGPDWLAVEGSGTVRGTPPTSVAGGFGVTLRVADDGSPSQFADQSYVLIVTGGFAAWQARHFNLPAEQALADPLGDADGDRLFNLGEYAYGRNPRVPDNPGSLLPLLAADGGITLNVVVRDDDPKLVVRLQASSEVNFSSPEEVSISRTDPAPGNGLQTVEFKDAIPPPPAGRQRFWRLRIELIP